MERITSYLRWTVVLLAAALSPAGARAEMPVGADSGTAFVIHGSGLLATCAHVIRAARDGARVEVVVAGKTLDARVVAQDDQADLALLQVQASELFVLPLAPAGGTRLGEEVRAFGFPLRGALGNSLKVTRGSVSGMDGEAAERVLQIDAAINRGNSGGPLVNDRGEVVGVVMAKLDMAGAEGVGFAVPAETLLALLGKHGAMVMPAMPGAARLEGPDLVARVQPAVARVTVTPRGKGQPDGEGRRRPERPRVVKASPQGGSGNIVREPAATPATAATVAFVGPPNLRCRPVVAPTPPVATAGLSPAEIEAELARIRETNPPTFPRPRADGAGSDDAGVNWLIVNDTQLSLLVVMSGPEKQSVRVKPLTQLRLVLKPGQYEIGGRLEMSEVEPFLGKFDLAAGARYKSRFFLQGP